MKQVPFYPNHEDGMRCMLACYKMVIGYFEHKKLSWEELVDITGYKSSKAAWSLKALVYLAAHGYNIRMIEPFDYAKYEKEGLTYLKTAFTQPQLDWQLKNTNILEIKKQMPDFLKIINYQKRSASLKDIDEFLDEDRLITVTLNSCALNNKEGYADHMVLVIGKDESDYIMHDSGGKQSGKAYRRVTREDLWNAMGKDDNKSEVTGFKRTKV